MPFRCPLAAIAGFPRNALPLESAMKKVRVTQGDLILMQSTLEAAFRILEIAPAVQMRRDTHNLYWIGLTIQEPSGEGSETRQSKIQGRMALQSLADSNSYVDFEVEGVRHDSADYAGKVKGWSASGRLDVAFYLPNSNNKLVARQFKVDRLGQLVN
jgi:hypothetical protein